MNRTVENLLTWAPLGAGLALILSHHRRWGLAVAMISPATVAMEHPRGMRKALKAVPKGIAESGKATGKAFEHVGRDLGRSAREVGKSLRWLAS